MIAPNMATMLCVIATGAGSARFAPARVAPPPSQFQRIVVDGDMSTNDTVIALANGASGVRVTDEDALVTALQTICTRWPREIVRDGEGATKFVTVHVTGAPDEQRARSPVRLRHPRWSKRRSTAPIGLGTDSVRGGVFWRRSSAGADGAVAADAAARARSSLSSAAAVRLRRASSHRADAGARMGWRLDLVWAKSPPGYGHATSATSMCRSMATIEPRPLDIYTNALTKFCGC